MVWYNSVLVFNIRLMYLYSVGLIILKLLNFVAETCLNVSLHHLHFYLILFCTSIHYILKKSCH